MMNSVVLIRDGPRRRAEASEDSWKERRTEKMWYPLSASSRRAAPSLSARRATSRISPAVVPTRQRNSLIETCPSTDPRPLILFLPKFTRIHPGVIIAQTHATVPGGARCNLGDKRPRRSTLRKEPRSDERQENRGRHPTGGGGPQCPPRLSLDRPFRGWLGASWHRGQVGARRARESQG